jgi:hypothetical protein
LKSSTAGLLVARHQLRVDEAPSFLCIAGGRKKKDLGTSRTE